MNENLLNSMKNIWIRQAYVQSFDCEFIIFEKYLNMFEHMEIEEYIYEGVVEHSYKKPTRAGSNRAGHSRKMRW